MNFLYRRGLIYLKIKNIYYNDQKIKSISFYAIVIIIMIIQINDFNINCKNLKLNKK